MHLVMKLIYFDIGLRFSKEDLGDFTILFNGLGEGEGHPGKDTGPFGAI